MKILKMQSKSNEPPFQNGDVTVTADAVIIKGTRYPLTDYKAVRRGLSYDVNVAYDETQPITQSDNRTETPAEPTETVQPTVDTPKQEQSVKPRFRMRKSVAKPVEPTPVAQAEPVPADEPIEPTAEEQELQKVLEQVRAIIDQPKADYEGVVELPDGGRLELRYFKGAD